MKKHTHTQCRLQKGTQVQTAWIPSEFANKGSFVKINEDDGWEVQEVFSVMDSEKVKENSDRIHKGIFDSIK